MRQLDHYLISHLTPLTLKNSLTTGLQFIITCNPLQQQQQPYHTTTTPPPFLTLNIKPAFSFTAVWISPPRNSTTGSSLILGYLSHFHLNLFCYNRRESNGVQDGQTRLWRCPWRCLWRCPWRCSSLGAMCGAALSANRGAAIVLTLALTPPP